MTLTTEPVEDNPMKPDASQGTELDADAMMGVGREKALGYYPLGW